MSDPFTQVHDAIWAMLEGHTEFAALVKPGNRVKYGGTDTPRIKVQAARPADTPEVRVVADAVDPHLFRTSDGSSFNRVFRIEIYTSDLRFTAGVFPVEWEILRAVAGRLDTLSSLSFVKKVRPLKERAPGIDPTKRTAGWYSVLAIDIEMWFRTASLPSSAE